MGTSIYGIGISGMNAAQAGLVTTGHNIANATTPGFSRQEVVQSTNISQFTGAGFFGQGATVNTVKRMYSDTLGNQLNQAQAQGSQLDTYYAQIQQLNSMLGDASAGLAPALQNFFTGVADLAAHPDSIPSRQSLLASANALTARFKGMDQQIAEMRSGVNAAIGSTIESINGYAQQIAGLNRSILVAESGGAQPANDLRDQRDQLVAELNQEVRASVVKDSAGEYNVFIGNGQPVVVGSKSFELIATPSLQDAQRVDVGYRSGSTVALLSPQGLQGGTLGGLLSFRADTLDSAQNALGRIAIGLAQGVNDQHALGQDLNGALGKDFFSVAAPAVLQNSYNAGSASAAADLQNADALSSSDYLLTYDGAAGGNETFTISRISDGYTFPTVVFPGAGGYPHSFDVDGVTVTVSAGAAAGDNWQIQPTRGGAADIEVLLNDPATIAAASPVRTGAALANRGSGTISAGSVASSANLPLPASVTLTFDATAGAFNVAGAAPPVAPIAYTSGNAVGFNGISFAISGIPAQGDVFTLEANAGGTGDNRNALALSALQAARTLGRNANITGSQASTSFQGAYSELVSKVGSTTRQTAVMATAQENMIAQTRQAQQSVSGVNLDEEAAKLMRYQQAYQAAGKMMQIAAGLFQTVLELGR